MVWILVKKTVQSYSEGKTKNDKLRLITVTKSLHVPVTGTGTGTGTGTAVFLLDTHGIVFLSAYREAADFEDELQMFFEKGPVTSKKDKFNFHLN
jgi:hypothetical protein